MPEIKHAPRLALNMTLAAMAVLATAAMLTLVVLRPGGHPQACPSGEEWIVAEPAGIAMAGYDGTAPLNSTAPLNGTATDPTAGTATSAAGSTAAGSVATGAAGGAAGTAATVAAPVLLAGCIDTGRLHPAPLSTDGRG